MYRLHAVDGVVPDVCEAEEQRVFTGGLFLEMSDELKRCDACLTIVRPCGEEMVLIWSKTHLEKKKIVNQIAWTVENFIWLSDVWFEMNCLNQ